MVAQKLSLKWRQVVAQMTRLADIITHATPAISHTHNTLLSCSSISVLRSRPGPPADRQLLLPNVFTSGFGRWGSFGEFVREVLVAAGPHR